MVILSLGHWFGADFAVGVVRVGVNTKDGTKGQGTSHCLLGVLVVVVVFGVTCAVGVVVAVTMFLCRRIFAILQLYKYLVPPVTCTCNFQYKRMDQGK